MRENYAEQDSTMKMKGDQSMPGGYEQVNKSSSPLYSGGDYQEELFSCFNDGAICLKSFFCGCCQYAENIKLISNGAEHYELNCCNFCWWWNHYPLTLSYKSRLRSHYNFELHPWRDWFAVCCCPGCALAQDSREIRSRIGIPKGVSID